MVGTKKVKWPRMLRAESNGQHLSWRTRGPMRPQGEGPSRVHHGGQGQPPRPADEHYLRSVRQCKPGTRRDYRPEFQYGDDFGTLSRGLSDRDLAEQDQRLLLQRRTTKRHRCQWQCHGVCLRCGRSAAGGAGRRRASDGNALRCGGTGAVHLERGLGMDNQCGATVRYLAGILGAIKLCGSQSSALRGV